MGTNNTRARLMAAGAGALLVITLGSCTRTSGPAEPRLGAIPAVVTAADLVLPLDAYRLSIGEHRNVQRAAWRLVRDCVARFGGRYTVSEDAMIAGLPTPRNENERRYGLFDLDSAQTRGYNLPPSVVPPSSPPVRWIPSPTELFLVQGATGEFADRALPKDVHATTLPPDGCLGEANRALAGGVPKPSDEQLANRLSLDSFHRSELDSRVRTVVNRWSACMKQHGYTYITIWQPNDSAWPEPPGSAEKATAAADVLCKQETRLVSTWFAVETAHQRVMVEQRAEELSAVESYVRAEASNAARIVNGQ